MIYSHYFGIAKQKSKLLLLTIAALFGLSVVVGMFGAASAATVSLAGCTFDDSAGVWTLQSDCSTSEQINIPSDTTLDGDGYTISANFSETDNDNNAVMGVIDESNVTIQNLTINGSGGTDLHLINTYESTNVVVENVNLIDSNRSGIVVNGTDVTVSEVTTAGSGWHGINVAQGSGVTLPSVLNIDGPMDQTADLFLDIYVDDITDDFEVNDDLGQYSVSNPALAGRNDQLYTWNDLIAPSVPSHIFPADGEVINSSNLYIDWSESEDFVNDDGDIQYKYRLYLENPDLNPSASVRYAKDYTGTTRHPASGFAPGTPEDSYWWRIQACDEAGNCSDYSEATQFIVDNTGPEVSGVVLNGQIVADEDIRTANCEPISNFYVVNGELDLSAVIEDLAGDVSDARYKVRAVNANGCSVSNIFSSGNTVMNDTDGDDTWEDALGFDTNGTPENGEYTIRLQTTDESGNSTVVFIDIIVDNTKPSVSITAPENGDVVKGLFSVNGIASDVDTSITEVKYTVTEIDAIGGTYVANVDSGVAVGTENWTFDQSGLDDGFYRLKVQAFDEAGNWRYRHHDVQVDTIRPVVTVVSPDAGSVQGSDFSITIDAEDGESGLKQVVANLYESVTDQFLAPCVNEMFTGESDATVVCDVDVSELGEGDFYIKTNARDQALNLSQTIAHEFTVDLTSPNVAITSPVADEEVEAALLGASIEDPNLSYFNVNLNKLGDTDWNFTTQIINANSTSEVLSDYDVYANAYYGTCDGQSPCVGATSLPTELPDGDYRARINAYDEAGNRTVASVEFTIDTTEEESGTVAGDSTNDPQQAENNDDNNNESSNTTGGQGASDDESDDNDSNSLVGTATTTGQTFAQTQSDDEAGEDENEEQTPEVLESTTAQDDTDNGNDNKEVLGDSDQADDGGRFAWWMWLVLGGLAIILIIRSASSNESV